MKLQRQKQADPVAQRKLLIKVVAFVIVLVVAISGVFIYSAMTKDAELHHVVTETEE